jgi:hypothetical protein
LSGCSGGEDTTGKGWSGVARWERPSTANRGSHPAKRGCWEGRGQRWFRKGEMEFPGGLRARNCNRVGEGKSRGTKT